MESAQCLAGSMLRLDVGWIPYSQLPSPATGQPGRDSSTLVWRLSPKCCFCRSSKCLAQTVCTGAWRPASASEPSLRERSRARSWQCQHKSRADSTAGLFPCPGFPSTERLRLIRQAQHSQYLNRDPWLLTWNKHVCSPHAHVVATSSLAWLVQGGSPALILDHAGFVLSGQGSGSS